MPKKNNNDTAIYIRLPTYMLDDLKKICIKRNLPVSFYVRNLIAGDLVKWQHLSR